ncbi:MAG: hypothetical protein NPIRA05_03720 [Nitrospirales bacterium]|nr:MAG: hypothetical protein NPIRA05_03720 [Nitrospirales bacterium]
MRFTTFPKLGLCGTYDKCGFRPGNTEKHMVMLIKINAGLDTVSAEIMKLLQEVYS